MLLAQRRCGEGISMHHMHHMHDSSFSDAVLEVVAGLQETLDRLRERARNEDEELLRELGDVLREIRSALNLG